MRCLVPIAVLLLAAGAACASDENAPQTSVSDDATGSETVEGDPTAPLEVDVAPPEGFDVRVDGREIDFAETKVEYVFGIASAESSDRIIVTSYLLPESLDTSTYDDQALLVTDYFKLLNSTISLNNYYPAIVHGHTGIYRFGTVEQGDNEIKWQDYFLFSGPYLINITCEWDNHYERVVNGCMQLVEDFPYPDGWAEASDIET